MPLVKRSFFAYRPDHNSIKQAYIRNHHLYQKTDILIAPKGRFCAYAFPTAGTYTIEVKNLVTPGRPWAEVDGFGVLK